MMTAEYIIHKFGACIYIGFEDGDSDITFTYIIEQEIRNNEIYIKNIYSNTKVGQKNILESFFKYNKDFEMDNLKNRLLNLIDKIDVIIEKKYLKSKITEYLENKAESEDTIKIKSGHITEMVCYGQKYESIKKFCEDYKIPLQSYYNNKRKGMSNEEIFDKYVNSERKERQEYINMYEYEGQQMSLEELSQLSGIKKHTIYQRLLKGWSVVDAVETPVMKKGERR